MERQPGELTATGGSWRSQSFEHARVSDVMRAGVIGCPVDASLRAVARMMATNHVHSVVLSASGRPPIRVISERELLAAAAPGAEDRDAESLSVEAVTVALDDPLARAVELMLEHQVSHLLVVDEGQHAVGVVSALDVAGVLAWGEA